MLTVACGLLALGVVAFLISPLLDPQRRSMSGKPEVEDLQRKKDFLYAAIRELNIDYHMGKLSEEDHRQLQHEYMQKASAVLDQLERSTNGKPHIDARIEQAVLDMRKKRALSRVSGTEEEAAVAFKEAPSEIEAPEKTCRACGTANERDAKFCMECGERLEALCEACGASVKADAKFCAQCGHRLGTDATA